MPPPCRRSALGHVALCLGGNTAKECVAHIERFGAEVIARCGAEARRLSLDAPSCREIGGTADKDLRWQEGFEQDRFRGFAQKSRELEIASQHKSRFVANMSHQLRTPLAAILGYAELIQEGFYGPLPEKSMDALTGIRSTSATP